MIVVSVKYKSDQTVLNTNHLINSLVMWLNREEKWEQKNEVRPLLSYNYMTEFILWTSPDKSDSLIKQRIAWSHTRKGLCSSDMNAIVAGYSKSQCIQR